MRKYLFAIVCVFSFQLILKAQKSFTLEQVMSAPFASELTASPKGAARSGVAWVLDERGARNLWYADAPNFQGRRLTNYANDDGQEIAEIDWTPDGRAILYARGGDFETGGDNPNPTSAAEGVEQAIWIAPTDGSKPPQKLTEGHAPKVSPRGDGFVFIKNRQLWWMKFGDEKPTQLIHAKGAPEDMRWSKDGGRVAFVNRRGDHSFIGVYDFNAKSLHYLDASVDRDGDPAWLDDNRRVAFIRIPSSREAFAFGPKREGQPWSIRVADVETGQGHEIWRADEGRGSIHHNIVADDQLFIGVNNRIAFAWERDGWSHLYSISANVQNARENPARLLTPGEFEVEHVTISPDEKEIIYSSNQNDIDRRHLWRVSIEKGQPVELTRGEGIEWSPVAVVSENSKNSSRVAFLHSDAFRPARAAVLQDGKAQDLAPQTIPADFPARSLVAPQPVILSAADGMRIHAQLFLPANYDAKRRYPAMIFFHGGSRRQMLLGWHYMNYYSNAYALNQFLASRGYIVLSVNYRSGIGYGMEFREAVNYGATGASEFNDVQGAGLYMRSRADVDAARIGLWGGSYGGYLTALGLARSSDLFSCGVDFHGVHDWNLEIRNFVPAYDPKARPDAARIAFDSSPLAAIKTWRSPVLLIHGDDDRNVPFSETVHLVEALREQRVEFEQLIFPDEIHGFLTHRRWLEAYHASADFLDRHLHP